jgi:Ca2+-binding RTX toxin-like protein
MFWLAGLLGLMAVGSVIFLENEDGIDTDDEYGDDLLPDPDTGNHGAGFVHIAPVPVIADIDPTDLADDLILPGTDLAETLTGGAGDDQIGGYDGDDLVLGAGGDDDLHGDGGDDTLAGGDGKDTLHGEDGDDDLDGDADDDRLFGHMGDDTLAGGDGDDTLHGGQGRDSLAGGDGDDAVHGNDGDDSLTGGDGADTLFGSFGDDTLSGMDDDDTDYLNGGDGNDWLLAGGGDIVTGGAGADNIVLGDWLAGADAVDLIDFDPTEDQLVVLWDLTGDPDPQIEIRTDADNPTLSHIVLDGVEIASVNTPDGLTAADILLVERTGFPIPVAA